EEQEETPPLEQIPKEEVTVVPPLDLDNISLAETEVVSVTTDLDVASAKQPAQPKASAATVWRLEYPATDWQGFYELKLARRDAAPETVLFAANVDPAEGNLKRVDQQSLKKSFGDAKIEMVTAEQVGTLSSIGSDTEVWWYLLWGVVVV